jgi:hypothetical protein
MPSPSQSIYIRTLQTDSYICNYRCVCLYVCACLFPYVCMFIYMYVYIHMYEPIYLSIICSTHHEHAYQCINILDIHTYLVADGP